MQAREIWQCCVNPIGNITPLVEHELDGMCVQVFAANYSAGLIQRNNASSDRNPSDKIKLENREGYC
jgi:hypothetical protein